MHTTFDLSAGLAAKEIGIARASGPKKELLARVRNHLRALAASRDDRNATADDASRFLVSIGLDESALGPATGGLFKTRDWQFTGHWVPSAKVANHARMLRVWRLGE